MASTEVVAVKSNQFQKGQSGNPAGRPKGSKNAITLVKLAIEGELRAEMKPHLSNILKQGIALAEGGDIEMIKYFLDKWVTPAKAGADDEAPRERIQITIGRLDDASTPVKGRTIEHEASVSNGN